MKYVKKMIITDFTFHKQNKILPTKHRYSDYDYVESTYSVSQWKCSPPITRENKCFDENPKENSF